MLGPVGVVHHLLNVVTTQSSGELSSSCYAMLAAYQCESLQGQHHGGLSGGALVVVIALPIVFGVAILITIPLLISRYKRRKAHREEESIERGMTGVRFIHKRTMSDVSETDKPLLLKTPARSSFGRVPSRSPEPTTYEFSDRPVTPGSTAHFPSITVTRFSMPTPNGKSPQERLADLANVPIPMLSPPVIVNKKPQPILVSIPEAPERPMAPVSNSMDMTLSTDLLHRPSFLTKPRPAPAVPGFLKPSAPSRRGRPDLRGALLTRLATKRSRSQGDPIDGDSPVSIYSQASLRRGDTHKWFPTSEAKVDPNAPFIPTLPQLSTSGAPEPRSELNRSYSFSGMPSPSRHDVEPSPVDVTDGGMPTPSTILQRRIFNDDTALLSPDASLVANSRWWSDVWEAYVPSLPAETSPAQAASGDSGFPVGRRGKPTRKSTHSTTKDASWFHATPQYSTVDDNFGRVGPERGQVMVSAWSLGSPDGKVQREARKLPPPPSATSSMYVGSEYGIAR